MCIKHLNQLKFGLSCLKINYRYALLDLFPLVNVYMPSGNSHVILNWEKMLKNVKYKNKLLTIQPCIRLLSYTTLLL